MPYIPCVYTVIETPVYSKKAEQILSEDERDAFAVYISKNPKAGVVVRGSGGVPKYGGHLKAAERVAVSASCILIGWEKVKFGC